MGYVLCRFLQSHCLSYESHGYINDFCQFTKSIRFREEGNEFLLT